MNVCILQIVYFNRIEVSQGINFKKTSESKERNICQYRYLLNSLRLQPTIGKRCNDLLIMSVEINDIAILNIRRVDFHCIISGISKDMATNLMQKPQFD